MEIFKNNDPWYLNGITGAIIPADRCAPHYQLVTNCNRLGPIEYGHSIHSAKAKVAYNTVNINEKAFVAGFEIELQPKTKQLIYDLHHGKAFKSNWLFLRRDKTLDYGGVEFVSIPLPAGYLTNKELYGITEQFKNLGLEPNKSCGFHIHVDHNYLTGFRTDANHYHIPMQLAAIELHQLYYSLSDKFLTALFGRKCNSYCRSIKTLGPNKHELNLMYDFAKRFGKHSVWPSCYHIYPNGGHYAELDLAGNGNAFTFEFRRGASTLDSERLFAMMDFVHQICKYIRYENIFFDGPDKTYARFTKKLKTKSRSELLTKLAEKYL